MPETSRRWGPDSRLTNGWPDSATNYSSAGGRVQLCPRGLFKPRRTAKNHARRLRCRRHGFDQLWLRDRRGQLTPTVDAERTDRTDDREHRHDPERWTEAGAKVQRRAQVAIGREDGGRDGNREGPAKALERAVHAGSLAHVVMRDCGHDGSGQ